MKRKYCELVYRIDITEDMQYYDIFATVNQNPIKTRDTYVP